jgi:hypothetical protein
LLIGAMLAFVLGFDPTSEEGETTDAHARAPDDRTMSIGIRDGLEKAEQQGASSEMRYVLAPCSFPIPYPRY